MTINVLTASFTIIALRWTWARRNELAGNIISRDSSSQPQMSPAFGAGARRSIG